MIHEPFDQIRTFLKTHRFLDAAECWHADLSPQTAADFATAILLAHALGNNRYATLLSIQGIKRFPDDWQAKQNLFFAQVDRNDPLKNYHIANQFLEEEVADKKVRGDFLCIAAQTHATLHFFDEANRFIEQALSIKPDDSWYFRMQLYFADAQDDRTRATKLLEMHLETFTGRETRSPKLMSDVAALLWKYGRAKESLHLLEQLASSQFYRCHYLRAYFLNEQERWEETAEILKGLNQRHLRYFDRNMTHSLKILEFNRVQTTGNFEALKKIVPNLRGTYFRAVEKNLKNASPKAQRILLELPLVSQKQQTCVPATIASISAYFGEEIDHDQLSEEVCVNGTPVERIWAWVEAKGWCQRLFTFTTQTATELLQKGIPFALYTEGLDYNHCQAVAGIDLACGELLIREPGSVLIQPMLLSELFKTQAIHGPLCIAFVPLSRAKELESISFKGETEYRLLIELRMALTRHNLEEAKKIVAKFNAMPREHPAALMAKVILARYQMASGEVKQLFKASYEANKKNDLACWRYVSALNYNEDSCERWKLLETICLRPKTHPSFRQEFANTLSMDSREWGRAEKLLRRVCRDRPQQGLVYNLLGDLLVRNPARVQDTFLAYRAAAFLDLYNDHFWKDWFDFSFENHRGEEVLEALKQRVEKLGDKRAEPAIAWADALIRFNRRKEALAVLDQQMNRFDEKGVAGVRTVELLSEYDFDEALQVLEKLRGKISKSTYRMTQASLLFNHGEWRKSLKLYREEWHEFPNHVVAFERQLDLGIRETANPQKLLQATFKDPEVYHQINFLVQVVNLARNLDSDLHKVVSERIVELDPYDTYWLRDLAIWHTDHHQIEEAKKYL